MSDPRPTRDIVESTERQVQNIHDMLITSRSDLNEILAFLVTLKPLIEAAEIMLDTPAARLRMKVARRSRGRTE